MPQIIEEKRVFARLSGHIRAKRFGVYDEEHGLARLAAAGEIPNCYFPREGIDPGDIAPIVLLQPGIVCEIESASDIKADDTVSAGDQGKACAGGDVSVGVSRGAAKTGESARVEIVGIVEATESEHAATLQ